MSGKTIWLTGLSGSGKSTLASALKSVFVARGHHCAILDGDILRAGLNRDLGFSALDRSENIRRASEIAKLLSDLGNMVFAAFITPMEDLRKAVRSVFQPGDFVEIFLNCPLRVCEARDPKGLYVKARHGLISEFTGITAPFQIPERPDFVIDTDRFDLKESIELVVNFLEKRFPEYRIVSVPKRHRDRNSRKVAVIGLDCAPPSIIFNQSGRLANIESLMRHGVWGPLKSTDPPITVPAWTTITTGRDPGELGLYGFRNRLTHDHYNVVTVNSKHVPFPRVWDHLEAHGKRSILVGIPQTFPAEPHSGVTIAGFPAIEDSPDLTHPHGLINDLSCLGNDPYLSDIRDFRTLPKDNLLQGLYNMADLRFRVAHELLLKESWDFFMMVEIAPDRLQHAFWGDYERQNPRNSAEARWKDVIPNFYKYLDDKIGGILALLDDETTVIIVSDHGAKKSTGGVCINEWLIRKGLLVLKEAPTRETSLTEDMIDWDKTYVWSEGGYYARIFMNVQGRERRGIIKRADYERFRDNLREELVVMPELNGERSTNVVLKPEELYRSVNGVAPDLIVYFDSLNKRSVGNVGMKSLLVKGNVAGLDACNHDHEGIFIATRLCDLRKGSKMDVSVRSASCRDIAPTIFSEYGLKCPENILGSAIAIGVSPETSSISAEIPKMYGRDVNFDNEGKGFTAEEEEIVRRRLSDLGYI